MRRPRNNCPVCGQNAAVTPSGRMWAHKIYRPGDFGNFIGNLCRGTGQPPRGKS